MVCPWYAHLTLLYCFVLLICVFSTVIFMCSVEWTFTPRSLGFCTLIPSQLLEEHPADFWLLAPRTNHFDINFFGKWSSLWWTGVSSFPLEGAMGHVAGSTNHRWPNAMAHHCLRPILGPIIFQTSGLFHSFSFILLILQLWQVFSFLLHPMLYVYGWPPVRDYQQGKVVRCWH